MGEATQQLVAAIMMDDCFAHHRAEAGHAIWYLRRPTGLASPLDRPPRYRVALHDMTTDDLGHALRALAPPDVAVAVLVRKR